MSHSLPVHTGEMSASPSHRQGMWWFLASEVVTFGGLIVAYLLMLFRHPEWSAEASHTLLSIGTINTVVLLTSSLTVILAHHEAHEGNIAGTKKYLVITMLLGLVFACFKSYEYSHEIHAGLLPSKSLFWSFYYIMTGLHMVHVFGGLIAFFFVFLRVRKGLDLQRVESVGIYWHFVDVVWIFLYPLLYIASGKGA